MNAPPPREEPERLRAENAALRDLLAAAQEHAALPEPATVTADWDKYLSASYNRLLDLRIWLQGTGEAGCSADELERSARRIRERTARPLRYAPEPPSIASDEAAAVLAASIDAGTPVIADDDFAALRELDAATRGDYPERGES